MSEDCFGLLEAFRLTLSSISLALSLYLASFLTASTFSGVPSKAVGEVLVIRSFSSDMFLNVT